MNHKYVYKVLSVKKSVDGDTHDLFLDQGFYDSTLKRIRLNGVDTYEIYGKNAHPLGVPARDFASEWMDARLDTGTLYVETFKLNDGTPVADGSFGPWAGEPYDGETGERLIDALRDNGFLES